jgi:TonB family protein
VKRLFLGLSCSVLLSAGVLATQAPSSTLTPGQVLLLANSTESTAIDKLNEALHSQDPRVRLIAGRVVALSGQRAGLDVLVSALAREQDSWTGAELVQDLLWLGGASAVPVVEPQTRRLGAEAILTFADWQARVQPEQFVSRLNSVASTSGVDVRRLGPMVAVASEGHPDQQLALMRGWMRLAPPDGWRPVLSALDYPGAPGDGKRILLEALASDRSSVRLETIWFILDEIASDDRPPKEVIAAAASAAPADSSPWEDFGRELIARATQGTTPRDRSELIISEGVHHGPFVATALRISHLTETERKAASAIIQSPSSLVDPQWRRQSDMRTVPPLESGLVADVLRAAGCSTTNPKMGAAVATYSSDGRPLQIQVDPTGLSGNCEEALKALARTTAAESGVAASPSFKQVLVLPLSSEFASCPGVPDVVEKPQAAAGTKVQQSRKLKDVKPVYPQSAQAARISGVVVIDAGISTTGCVYSARVVRSIPQLDFAAVAAVTQWQFSPTLFNNQPIPVLMTVTVNFALR